MGGGAILMWLLFAVVISPAIGYWCMTVFRSKGRSPGAGFAVGFFLTFLSTIQLRAVYAAQTATCRLRTG